MIDIVLTLMGIAAIMAISIKLIQRKVDQTVDAVAGIFENILTQPTVSKAFGILGKQSGDARSQRAVIDSLANDVLSGPKFSALKMGASMMGIDLDDYIAEHGALNTLEGLQQIGGALGINVNDILQGGLTELPANPGNSKNPYF